MAVSPFQRNVLTIRQNVRANRGRVVGLRVEDLIVDERLLSAEDLFEQALLRPAQELLRLDPARQIVVLIDALDEIRYHATRDNILAWLTNCPELPSNVRFVLSSRPPDNALQLFCDKQSGRLARVAIDEGDVRVTQDVAAFVQRLIAEPDVAQALHASEQRDDVFAARAQEKAHGNLGYLDALARGIQQALARKDSQAVQMLLGLGELPADLTQLYGFFLEQIRASVARERIELRDPNTGEAYDKPAWPAVYDPLLGVLAVATRPLELELLLRLTRIRVDPVWVTGALDRLTQFLDVIDGRYRLYHATVAEYLTSGNSLVDAGNWHRRIAEHYWANQRDWSQCDSYGLDSLAIHLSKSNDSPRLFQLVDPAWMRARVAGQATSYRGFFADLDAVKEDLRRLAHAADCPPNLVGRAVRVMLVRTSINSVTNANAPAFVAEAVARGRWTVERALNVARQVPDADDRVDMYLSLLRAGGLVGAARKCAADEALEAVLEISRDVAQGRALAKLAPFLDESAQLDKAWHAASKIRSKWQEVRAVARTALAIRMSGPAKEQALHKALEDSLDADDGDPMDTLPTLAPYLSEDLKGLALKKEGTLPEAITALRSRLTEGALAELCRRAMTVGDTQLRIRILGTLAPALPVDQRTRVWPEVLAGIEKARGHARRNLLREVVPSIEESLIAKLLEIALDIPNAVERAEAIALLAPRLSGAQRARTVATALRIAKRGHHDRLIEELLPLLSAQQLRSLGKTALATDTWLDKDVILALLSRVPTELGAELLTRLSDLDSEDFVTMVKSLPEQRRRDWVQSLYAIASEMNTPQGQADALAPSRANQGN